MTDSTLFPPNSHWLSDNVIGSVLQRSRPSSRSLLDKRKRAFDKHDAGFDADLTARYEQSVQATYQPSDQSLTHKAQPFSNGSPPEHKHPLPRGSVRSTSSRRSRYSEISSEVDALERHRERRRLTQIRYRTKLRDRAETLQEEVKELREEVQKLESQKRSKSSRVIANATPALPCCGSQAVYESHVHRDFLQKTMAPGVLIDDERGVETMLERWRMVSISQPNFEVQVVRLEGGPGGCIFATTRISIVMCDQMLHHTFPNLDESERGRRLAAKLRGQRFEIDDSTVFTWDDTMECMMSVQNKSDVFTPMIRFLGSLEDVVYLFDEKNSRLPCRRLLCPSA
ncbi:hypothetical protein PF002_g29193 [Phytophthora fragariae]|uniref:BZIP domain-containing protein n=1 Tax=Phytophthora fragariae TaxID=53985 RepID=A0A6A3VV59_9STRA|nr:hypothetical protein PF004_g29520 [Phytophthora fragariae]KAE9173916.1 hypothetical protein PF002_g29193 [Phytophthora fragariae]KAE9270136.1 hypothetical protein PF001_g28922 [Phytophthora fragariae]